jgi:hypothetical protein
MDTNTPTHLIAVRKDKGPGLKAETVDTVYQRGLYAVHKRYPNLTGVKAGYTVSHLPTGLSVCVQRTKRLASKAVKLMNQHAYQLGEASPFGLLPEDDVMDELRNAYRATTEALP